MPRACESEERMSNKPNLSKDGSFIDFKQSESVPTSAKKFRQSPEIQGFYSFVYDNGLRLEAYEILTQILNRRKALRAQELAEQQVAAQAAAAAKLQAKLEAKAAAKAARQAAR